MQESPLGGPLSSPTPVSPQNSNLASVIVGAIQVLFTGIAALIMDRAGRRLLLILSGETPGLSPARGITRQRPPRPTDIARHCLGPGNLQEGPSGLPLTSEDRAEEVGVE